MKIIKIEPDKTYKYRKTPAVYWLDDPHVELGFRPTSLKGQKTTTKIFDLGYVYISSQGANIYMEKTIAPQKTSFSTVDVNSYYRFMHKAYSEDY